MNKVKFYRVRHRLLEVATVKITQKMNSGNRIGKLRGSVQPMYLAEAMRRMAREGWSREKPKGGYIGTKG